MRQMGFNGRPAHRIGSGDGGGGNARSVKPCRHDVGGDPRMEAVVTRCDRGHGIGMRPPLWSIWFEGRQGDLGWPSTGTAFAGCSGYVGCFRQIHEKDEERALTWGPSGLTCDLTGRRCGGTVALKSAQQRHRKFELFQTMGSDSGNKLHEAG